ncbi:MAG: tRNA uracil 4-sulfurtransferase ThiI [Bullifex sp.]
MKKLYLIKLGEISLKGLNRSLFENRLRHNIKDKLRPYHSNVVKQKGRVFFYIDEECPDEVIEKAFSTTFGIAGYAEAVVCEKDIERIKDRALYLIKKAGLIGNESFKIHARREDKGFALSSYEIDCILADLVHELYPEMRVDLKNPEFTLNVEVRKEVYLYTSEKRGIGGLPTSTAGKGLLLLSGGIDSPVAGFEMAKRGVKLDCLYFHAYPYTSDEALEKVKTLARLISPYLGGTRLFVVPFTRPQLHIRDNAYEDETTLMFRACMMQVAERLCRERGLNCIITGEALSQVASQTLAAMSFTDSMTEYLVLRPLVGMDKEEIIAISKRIGTYETSILPFEDCCVIFSPKHPVTNPDKALMKKHFDKLDMGEMLDKAVRETVVYAYNAKGEEIIQQEE